MAKKTTQRPWRFGGPGSWESIVKFPSVGVKPYEVGPDADHLFVGDGIAIVRNKEDAELIVNAVNERESLIRQLAMLSAVARETIHQMNRFQEIFGLLDDPETTTNRLKTMAQEALRGVP